MNDANEHKNGAAETTRSGFNFRGFFSLLLFCSFTLLTVSGVMLYVAPRCRIAEAMGWTMLGVSKGGWSAMHMTLPILAVVATGFHLYYNWTIFWGYIKRKARGTLNLKWEMALAVLLCVITVVGSLLGVPPFGTIVQWHEDMKEYWDSRSAEEGLQDHGRGEGGGERRGAGTGQRRGTGSGQGRL